MGSYHYQVMANIRSNHLFPHRCTMYLKHFFTIITNICLLYAHMHTNCTPISYLISLCLQHLPNLTSSAIMSNICDYTNFGYYTSYTQILQFNINSKSSPPPDINLIYHKAQHLSCRVIFCFNEQNTTSNSTLINLNFLFIFK